MTKHLRFLIVLLMTLVWSTGGAQTTIDFTNGLPADWSKKGTVAKVDYQNKSCIQLYAATITSSAFKDAFSSMKISLTRSKNGTNFTISYQIGNAAAVLIKTYTSSQVTKGSWKDYIIDIPTAAQVANCKFIFKSDQASYYISSIEFTKAGPSKTPTKVAFPAEYSNKTFTFTEGKLEGFTAPTATETNNVAGTIKYSSDNESAVKVNASTGELSFPGYGEATITATFTPTNAEKYKESSDSYMVVNNNPNVKKVTFIDTIDKGNNTSTGKSDEITKDGVTIFGTNAAFGNSNGDYRFYKGTKINISVTTGTIIKIEFKNGKDLNNLKGEGYTATSNAGTWTGNARTVVLTNSSSVAKAETITVYVTLPSEITLDETDINNTIEAKTGVNVTLKRTMAKGVWNTICLPFNVTYDVAKAAFGNDVKIAELDGSSTGTTLSFKNVTNNVTNNVIKASVPYLIKPTIDAPADGYKFEGVEITEAAVNPTKVKTAGGLYFNGVYNMVDATTEVTSGYNAAFLGKGNTVFGAQSGTNMKGFRAYFAIPNSVKASELRVVIDGTATSIKNIDSEVVESNAPVYNLQGQRVDGSNLTPGIYVKAGKKFVVK